MKIKHSRSLYGAPYGLTLNFAKMPSQKSVPNKVFIKATKCAKKGKMPLSSDATLRIASKLRQLNQFE